mgnify:FL=1
MRDFLKIQLELYRAGGKSIGFEKIKALAAVYLTDAEREELFKQEGGDAVE